MDLPEKPHQEDIGHEGERAWLAFIALSTRRQFSDVGAQPIALQAIWCYIDLSLNHIDEDEVEDLLYFLDVLDSKYLEHQARKLEKQGKAGTRKGRSRR